MRIVIDLQGAQSSGSRDRGIGRYVKAISKALIRNKGKHEIMLALNGMFPETIQSIREEFDGLISQKKILVWDAVRPVNHIDGAFKSNRNTAELLREAFIASLNPDVVLITSLFEGLVDDAVTSIGALTNNVLTASIVYDLIPYLNREVYLQNPVTETFYEEKIGHLRRADLLLAISESSRQECLSYLGFPKNLVVNISTAADSHFFPEAIAEKEESELRCRYMLYKPFVMYTGGIDYRKNIEALIRAYASLEISLRKQHQLAIICSVQPEEKRRLENIAKSKGLKKGEIILTGFVPEKDLVSLYNLCKLFVFPSLHEGFGLPVLEAMKCGKAVIGSNTSSIPEVIGRDDALFDPANDEAIAAKLGHALLDDVFRAQLEEHGINQAKKFTWERSARRAIKALEEMYAEHEKAKTFVSFSRRPKMAYVSPLPPERSGISYYSVELLPELSRYYDIDVVVDQKLVSDPWVSANCRVRDINWFRSNARSHERVLYHFGNSTFHQHMFGLLEEIPGVVVLHDFFLSGVVAHMENSGVQPASWSEELYFSHGYNAMCDKFSTRNIVDVIWNYPCNRSVLAGADGIIVHSENSRRLTEHWYGASASKALNLIPLLRAPAVTVDRGGAWQSLNLKEGDFVVCSFGLLGNTKLNHRLINAWLDSDLAKEKNCFLVFVGENDPGQYGQQILKVVKENKCATNILITGWADSSTYSRYLGIANIGVQLRKLSRGETSAAVLDCMNYGVPTIVNMNGSMADLPDKAVLKIPDEFSDAQLTEALEKLWRDECLREKLANNAKKYIFSNHSPRQCAYQYFNAIEGFRDRAETSVGSLTGKIAELEPLITETDLLLKLSNCIAHSIFPKFTLPQVLVDVTELVNVDPEKGEYSGKQALRQLLMRTALGFRVEPVYVIPNKGYYYARNFTSELLNFPRNILKDDPIEYRNGDIFIGLSLKPEIILPQRQFYQSLIRYGVVVKFIVDDLIFLQELTVVQNAQGNKDCLKVVAESHGAICFSKIVTDELMDFFLNESGQQTFFGIDWLPFGLDFDKLKKQKVLSKVVTVKPRFTKEHRSFLMVGSIEVHTGHTQTLEAFEQLWQEDSKVDLVILGKQGWMVEEFTEKLRSHKELNKRLFWFEDIPEEYLIQIYKDSTCLLVASESERFDLPLVDAACYKLPLVFRETPFYKNIAGEHAFYFNNDDSPNALVSAIREWLILYESDNHPKPKLITKLTLPTVVKPLRCESY